MLKSSLCDYSDVNILVNGTIRITRNVGPPTGRITAQLQIGRENNERNKGVIFNPN